MNLDEILTMAVKKGASDIHIKINTPPLVRINKRLIPLIDMKINANDIDIFLDYVIQTERHRNHLEEFGEIDLSYSISGISRFRVNIYKQRGTYAFAFRTLKMDIPDIDSLHLPKKLYEIAMEKRGIVLVTGPTGTGKSTTLASMINYRNKMIDDVIITLEDPIEYVFRDNKSYIVQREIGIDTREFATALKAALREDPDVIMVGEMRDLETIETALRAAETGHLVFSTLHTTDAKETINRIIDVFPKDSQNHIRLLLASTLKAVISQRLIPRSDQPGLVPAVEILLNQGAVFDAIQDPEKFVQIDELMEKGHKQYGMQTFDQSIMDLYEKGYISKEDALLYATNPSDLSLKMKGISSGEFSDEFFYRQQGDNE